MQPEEMRELLEQIGWSSNELARRLGINQRSVGDYRSGKRPIPDNLASWLRAMAAAVRAMPAQPENWR
jgi:transcriptional regulator with XRE-family HTH domain